jgi:hypothetical protein
MIVNKLKSIKATRSKLKNKENYFETIEIIHSESQNK